MYRLQNNNGVTIENWDKKERMLPIYPNQQFRVLDASDQTLSCHLRKAKKHEAYQKAKSTDYITNLFQVIRITLRKKGLFAARIAEQTCMVSTRKTGVLVTV